MVPLSVLWAGLETSDVVVALVVAAGVVGVGDVGGLAWRASVCWAEGRKEE